MKFTQDIYDKRNLRKKNRHHSSGAKKSFVKIETAIKLLNVKNGDD